MEYYEKLTYFNIISFPKEQIKAKEIETKKLTETSEVITVTKKPFYFKKIIKSIIYLINFLNFIFMNHFMFIYSQIKKQSERMQS
jgi:hypothetical protein